MLNTEQIDRIIKLLEPFTRTEAERDSLLAMVFAGIMSKPDINLSGAPVEATRRMVRSLIDYGEITEGNPALWVLLHDVIYNQVGVDKQQEIDALYDVIFKAIDPLVGYELVKADGTHLFISYSRADGVFVDRLREDLKRAGVNVCRQPKSEC